MLQIHPFSDSRLDFYCTYCGNANPDTKDHVPSKVLLDDPFPENLPEVPCCYNCNQGFSLHEEYMACLIECVLCGTTEIEQIKNPKIKRILTKREALLKRLSEAMIHMDDEIHFKIETERIEKVLLKLARGHIKYEHSEGRLEEPASIKIYILEKMTEKEKKEFFSRKNVQLLPEVGSRAFSKLVIANNMVENMWQIVQPDVYEYSTYYSENISVRLLIRNYLAVDITWEN